MHAAQTASERQATLQQKSTHECERMAAEIPEERETRLQWMKDRLAAETPDERETRLQQMSTNQQLESAGQHSFTASTDP